ncbi:Cytochrome c [Vibrio chagasii]|uniref:c-type cytochrome n=1 Tax=Vibrio chagasii TaxID=170679 RepID=UPI001EFE22D9|nr:c-type cytochrome [Vibrio chagasii]MCG9569460.1 c-type cytochrome [Vibrio chagasii]CAH6804517.1 Cytochrome c [Vibrio chagasii]CAH6872094.1 Cytochrome c [Vibrio chagasii]CAH7058284.1 Cytochrome c [Vibrio chagasii]CAH7065119.1 Cytochrome c [Vibrio chagasii]
MNLTKFTLLFVASTVAVILSLSACTDEQPNTKDKVASRVESLGIESEPSVKLNSEAKPEVESLVDNKATAKDYIPSLMVGEKLVNNLCSQCHGDKIIPFVQSYPNIKGQKSSYILKQLRDFKSDSRQDLYMQSVVKSLSDKDLQDVAAFYSTLKPLDLYERSQKYYHQ